MDWWLNLSAVDVEHLAPIAQKAEALGFTGVALGDHLVFPERRESPYPYSSDGRAVWEPDAHWPDAWVAIAAMAAVTRSLRFTTGVYVAPLRHPVLIAKSLSTLARLSGDRVAGGFGTGWLREEFELMGEPFANWGARLDEQLEILRRLWTGEMVEYVGRHYSVPRVRMCPAPLRRLPIYIGGHAEAALRRAAGQDGWIGVHKDFDSTAADIARVRALRRARPDPEPFYVMMVRHRARPEDVKRFEQAGADGVILTALALSADGSLPALIDGLARTAERLGIEPLG
jgi:probable F420-dependent oxidoreductase